MSLVISVPSKSFFAGEYSALNGGPAITVATAPRFELRVRAGAGWTTGINKDSPAGKLIQQHSLFFNQFDLEFFDPHMGRGGWGASTAQFLAAYRLLHWQGTADERKGDQENGHESYFDHEKLTSPMVTGLLENYKQVAWDGRGLPPSGADLIGQLKGGFTFFEKRKNLITSLKWAFSDLEFYLIPTGAKVATHHHLQELSGFNTDLLESYVRRVQVAFTSESKSGLIEGLHFISKELQDRHWVVETTKEYLKVLNAIPGVLAAKGCGALGADVVLVVVEKSKSVLFEALLKDEEKPYFSRHHISKGLEIQVKSEMNIEPFHAGI